MSKYYSEEITKDSKYRQEYVDSMQEFLTEWKQQAEMQRREFISPERYVQNTESYREKFIQMLGFPLMQPRIMPTVEKAFVITDGNVDIYRMQFTFSNKVKFYGIYFEQIEKTVETPFVFGLHGGKGTSESVSSIHGDSYNYNHLVRRITDRGASVFAPQFLLWDREQYGNEYERQHTDGKFRQLGGSMTAAEVYFLRCILDYFLAKEQVNKDKIGVAGLSYGGMYALHFAAVETRIKAAFSCSYVNDVFIHSWADWSYFNAQNTFTTAETIALVAPRSIFIAMGDEDNIFNAAGTVAECKKALPYFKAFGKEDNLRFKVFRGIHETDKENEWLDFLFQKLK